MADKLGTSTVNAGCSLSGDYYNIPRRGAFKKLEIRHKRLSDKAFTIIRNRHVIAKSAAVATRLGKRAKVVYKK